MKNTQLFALLGFVILFFTSSSFGQVTVTSSTVTSPPATACTSTFLTVSGTHNYGGYTYNGATVNVTGSTVSVTLNYTFGIGIAVITPFTQSVDIGMIPAGNYTMLTNGSVNGAPYGSYTSALNVVACCGAVPSFTTDKPSYCLGDSIYLTNTSTGSTSQQWFNNGAPVSPSMNYATVVTSATLDIGLVVTNGTCFDTTTQTITGMPIPVINSLSVTADTACIGELLTFSSSSSGAVGAGGKSWFKDGATAGFGTNLTTFSAGVGPHDYMFIASNGACADTDVISVEYLSAASIDSFLFQATDICIGDYVTGTAWTDNATNTDWFIDNIYTATSGSGSNYSNIPTSTGTFTYKMITSNGFCADSITQTINVNAIPTIDLGPDTNACAGNVLLDAGSGYFYLWNDGSTLQNLTVSDAGTYYVEITSTDGCSATDTIVFTSCVGLNENTLNTFKVGPNPTSSTATVLLGKVLPTANVKVIGAEGKLYYEHNFDFVESIVLDVESLESGVYFVQVGTETGVETLRLVKE